MKSLRPTHHRLHWRLDVTMNEDAARNRMDNGPHNLAVLRHMALNVMGREESKTSCGGMQREQGISKDGNRRLGADPAQLNEVADHPLALVLRRRLLDHGVARRLDRLDLL